MPQDIEKHGQQAHQHRQLKRLHGAGGQREKMPGILDAAS